MALCQSASPLCVCATSPLVEPTTHLPGGVARDPERQREIIFARDLPVLAPADAAWRIVRNVPAVVLEAPDQAVARALEEPVPAQVADMVLEQDQPRPPARKVEAAHHLE